MLISVIMSLINHVYIIDKILNIYNEKTWKVSFSVHYIVIFKSIDSRFILPPALQTPLNLLVPITFLYPKILVEI